MGGCNDYVGTDSVYQTEAHLRIVTAEIINPKVLYLVLLQPQLHGR